MLNFKVLVEETKLGDFDIPSLTGLSRGQIIGFDIFRVSENKSTNQVDAIGTMKTSENTHL